MRLAAWPAFSLPTFAQRPREMVASTVEIVRDLREHPESVKHLVVDGELVVRSSARVPKAGFDV